MLNNNLPMNITREAELLLEQLPKDITRILLEKMCGDDATFHKVIQYFEQHSSISQILMEYPGSHRMLELIYTGCGIADSIDKYFYDCLAAQALRDRLQSITNNLDKIIPIRRNALLLNLGSGTSRDCIQLLSERIELLSYLTVHCIDTSKEALEIAGQLCRQGNVEHNFKFIQDNLMELRYRYEADAGLFIGILCSLEDRVCKILLQKARKYFKPGALVIASNVMTTILEKDPFTSYLLEKVIGWKLVYKTPERLQKIFEDAGYEWQGLFFDEPLHFHAMGIGKIPQ